MKGTKWFCQCWFCYCYHASVKSNAMTINWRQDKIYNPTTLMKSKLDYDRGSYWTQTVKICKACKNKMLHIKTSSLYFKSVHLPFTSLFKHLYFRATIDNISNNSDKLDSIPSTSRHSSNRLSQEGTSGQNLTPNFWNKWSTTLHIIEFNDKIQVDFSKQKTVS